MLCKKAKKLARDDVIQIFDYLKKRGVNYLELDNKNKSPLHYAVDGGTDDLVITDKFIVKHPGDWEFEAGQVEKSKFNSRKEFDETVVPEEDREIPREPFHGNISIRGAFKKFPSAGCIDISMRNVKENEIEDDLFNKEMIQLFGECKDDILNPETNVKQFMLKDFNILTCDGNFTIATAERDINYLFFCHCY